LGKGEEDFFSCTQDSDIAKMWIVFIAHGFLGRIGGVEFVDNVYIFQQNSFTARFEWGYEGVRVLAPVSDIVVIIDVLSFTTCVDVALNRDGVVFPYRFRDSTSREYAAKVGAVLAGKRGEPLSLSPASLSTMEKGTRIVLPSPNGATCSFLAKDSGATVIAACLRNASAVARYVKQKGGTVSVIASGERWPDGSLRPAYEDLVAAGAVLSELTDYHLSPEAKAAVAVYEAGKMDLSAMLEASSSGQELIAAGFREDVVIASEQNASERVPVLNGEGAFVTG
jgi:2-phosphosulfolactate phosphatase